MKDDGKPPVGGEGEEVMFTRRDFLKQSAAFLAAIGIPPTLPKLLAEIEQPEPAIASVPLSDGRWVAFPSTTIVGPEPKTILQIEAKHKSRSSIHEFCVAATDPLAKKSYPVHVQLEWQKERASRQPAHLIGLYGVHQLPNVYAWQNSQPDETYRMGGVLAGNSVLFNAAVCAYGGMLDYYLAADDRLSLGDQKFLGVVAWADEPTEVTTRLVGEDL